MSSKKNSTDKKSIVFIIVIVLLALVLVIENFGILSYLVLRRKSDYKYIKSPWVNSYTLKGIKYRTEIEFNNGFFNYKSLKNDELDFTINGQYKISDDSIYMEYFNSENDSMTTYSLKYNKGNDYLCFNHNSDCKEEFRFYRAEDERSLKYVELEDKYDDGKEKETEKEEKEEIIDPQFEKDVVPTLYVFYGEGCPHCEELFEWLGTFNYENKYELVKYEVWYNESNNKLMKDVASHFGVKAEGVPFIVVGNGTMTGFSKYASPAQIKSFLDDAVKASSEGTYLDVIKHVSK